MKGYPHLTYEQRCQIYALNKSGKSSRSIGQILGIHHSRVCRELRRNKGLRGYRYKQAQRLSEVRKIRDNPKMTLELTSLIKEKLQLQWSPQQISGWLKRNGHGSISHERIYQHIWQDKKQGGDLYRNLRRRGKKYNKRIHKNSGRGLIPGRVDIDERPAIVDEQSRIGDWELDTIIGAGHKCAIVSMVERTTKFTRLRKVHNKSAREVTKSLVSALRPHKDKVLTLTSDNGKEFAGHFKVSEKLDADFYFAKPYHSWERGLNEHTNGLVRQYFPKNTCFEAISDKDIRKVENLLNNRPRAVLHYRTPAEVFCAV